MLCSVDKTHAETYTTGDRTCILLLLLPVAVLIRFNYNNSGEINIKELKIRLLRVRSEKERWNTKNSFFLFTVSGVMIVCNMYYYLFVF